MNIYWHTGIADCCGDIVISPKNGEVTVTINDTLWCHWEEGVKTFNSLEKAIEGLTLSFGRVKLVVKND